MRSSFFPIHPDFSNATERELRRDAEVFLFRSGALLIEVLGQLEGEDGLALGHAFLDLVLDPEMPSSSWPVSEVLDVLASADPDIRCRTAGFWAALNGLLARMDPAQVGLFLDSADPAASGIRSAA
jgi:hypothetical protein